MLNESCSGLPYNNCLLTAGSFRPGPESESHWGGCEGSRGQFVCEDGAELLGRSCRVMDKGNDEHHLCDPEQEKWVENTETFTGTK